MTLSLRTFATRLFVAVFALTSIFQSAASAHAAVSFEYLSAYVVLPSVQEAVQHATSFQYDLLIDAKEAAHTTAVTGVKIDGQAEKSATNAPSWNLLANLSVLNDGSVMKDAPAMSALVYGDQLFVKASGLGNLGGDSVQAYDNKWILIDEASIRSLYPTLPSEKTTPSPEMKKMEAQFFQDLVTKKVVAFTDIHNGEMIDGVSTYRLPFEVDFLALADVTDSYATPETAAEVRKVSDGMRALTKQNMHLRGDLFVGTDDYLPRRLTVKATEDDPSASAGSATMTLSFSHYNQPLHWDIPTNPISLAQAMGGTEGLSSMDEGLSSERTLHAPTAGPSADNDRDGLTNAQESFYGTDPDSVDTDGDGYTDATEIQNGYNPLGTGKPVSR